MKNVSYPVVFTRERDLSFLPVGVDHWCNNRQHKRNFFVPTLLNSFDEFTTEFGEPDDKFYTPLTIQKYFQEVFGCNCWCVLGIGGYTNDYMLLVSQVQMEINTH